MNIIQGKKSYMHHIAFQLINPGHQYASSDILMRHNISTIWDLVDIRLDIILLPITWILIKMLLNYIQIWINNIPELNIMEPRPWHNRTLSPKI